MVENLRRVLVRGDGIGRVKPLDASVFETIAKIQARAERLVVDAELLLDSKSYDTAVSLALLAIEECGKACIFLWAERGHFKKKDLKRSLLSHECKQRVYACYMFARKAIDQIEPEVEDMLGGRIPYIVVDDQIEKAAKADYSEAMTFNLLTEIGFHDRIKQSGFYAEVDGVTDSMGLKSGSNMAQATIVHARRALKMLAEDESVQAAVAATYNQGPRFNFGTAKKKKLKEFFEIYAQVLKG